MFYEWRPYVSVAERRRKSAREMEKLKKKGHPVSPVLIEGRKISRTFWGNAWCDHLERYSDYSSRLPRGRTYVRNGSVVDLQISPGEVAATVSGSELYKVVVKVKQLPTAQWTSIRGDCAGAIDSLVELLQARLSKGVMERICHQKTGLFPAPTELSFSCSCPDWASMCKHVAAVLYGIGARFDHQPELLFKLRQVDEAELISMASEGLPLSKVGPAADRVLAGDGLSELFGLEMDDAKGLPKAKRPKAGATAGVKKAEAKPKRGGQRGKRPAKLKPKAKLKSGKTGGVKQPRGAT